MGLISSTDQAPEALYGCRGMGGKLSRELREAKSCQAAAEAEAQRLAEELREAQDELSKLQLRLEDKQPIAPKRDATQLPAVGTPAVPVAPSPDNTPAEPGEVQPEGADEPSTPDDTAGESDEERKEPGAAPPPTPGERVPMGDLPVPEGVEADSLGVRPSPMNGGNNNYMQFRRHFRVATASLFRKLHGVTSSRPIDVIRLATLEGMLWMAVKCYMADLLLGAERAALASGEPSPISSNRARQDLDNVAQLIPQLKTASRQAVSSALEMEAPLEGGADVASLMRCMRDLTERARQYREQSSAEHPEQAAQDILRAVEEQEELVARLRSTVASLGATSNGVQLVVQSQMEGLGALQVHYKDLLSAGQQEEASMVYSNIQNVNDEVVRHLATLDTLAADQSEARKAADKAAALLERMRRNQQDQAGQGAADQAGTSAAHARLGLESQLRQARSQLYVARLDTDRRSQNITRKRSTVEKLRQEYNRQHADMMDRAATGSILPGAAAQQATFARMNDMGELWQAANVVHTALITLEQELEQEQAALQASMQETSELRQRVTALEAQLAALP